MAMSNEEEQFLSDIKVAGFNTHGLKSNVPFVTNLINSFDVLFVSEHWLSNAERLVIKDIVSPCHKIHFSSAEKQASGRPYGGNVFIVNSINAGATTIVHEEPHILAIKATLNSKSYIYIGLYLTCFRNNTSVDAYKCELNTLSSIIKLYEDECEIVMLGDFQTFPEVIYDNHARNHHKRNPLSKPLHQFLQAHNLDLYDVTEGTGPLQTYQHRTLPHSSYIDHIIMSRDNPIPHTNCVIHETNLNNMSDHQPISITLKYENPSIEQIVKEESKEIVIPSFAWKDDNFICEYNNESHKQLTELFNTDCNPSAEDICAKLHNSSDVAFKVCFPEKTRNRHSKSWWSTELSNLKNILTVHFKTWKEYGFPKDELNVYYNRYLLARKNFRKGVKLAQNKKVYESLHKMNGLKDTHPRKFWSKIRQLRKSDNKRLFEINGKRTTEDIVHEFADNFNTLFNNPIIERTPGDERSLPSADTEPNQLRLSVEDIDDAILKLKENKSADPNLLVAEHVIYSDCILLKKWLCNFYNTIFDNQSTHSILSTSVLHPLVKSSKKSMRNFGNYRGISIIPVLTKLLEYIILMKYPELCHSHISQHGYKSASSTLHAEFLIRETLHYYNTNRSPVYICGLDAEKAFDSVNWDILFEKLFYDKKIPLAVVNVIKSLYLQGTANVKYNGRYSYQFSLSQGVRQGSVLSPHLYNIYTEDLLTSLSQQTLDGTNLFGHYTGILMYADDIILMSPTLSGLKSLINTCNSVSRSNCINFNTDKTEFCISYNCDPLSNSFAMNGYTVKASDGLKHLGVLWNIKKNILTMDDANVDSRLSKFWAVIKALIKEGIRFCQPQTIKQLYISIAVPTLTYSLELCELSDKLRKKLDIEGRKALKQLFNISSFSKNHLNSLLNIEHISTRLIKNKFNLLTRLLHSKHTSNIILQMLSSPNSNSTFITNIMDISYEKKINFMDVLVSRKTPLISDDHKTANNNEAQQLIRCLNTWCNPNSRKRFVEIMEGRVVRTAPSE